MPLPRLKLRVSPAAESKIRAKHPWIYDGSVREQNREGTAGELAVIYDRNDTFLALGLYDPESPLRVRVLHSGKPATLNDAWWERHLDLPVSKRVFGSDTTGFRFIHGENDGWPGLVLDRYADTLVLKIYTAAWRPWLDRVTRLIVARLAPKHLILRTSRNIDNDPQPLMLHGPPLDGPVVFTESGIKFEADAVRGQKTGFFLDQRENRQLVEELSSGRAVLNAFSFSGGFSVYAARGGATCVTSLDLSRHALESAHRNFALNGLPHHETIQADAFEWIAAAQRKFDLIVLDPPSLAKRESERAGALRAYTALASRAIQRLRKGGILVACSCSAHVPADEFFAVIRSAGGSTFKELRTTRHPSDHPATFPEAHYLKAIYLRF